MNTNDKNAKTKKNLGMKAVIIIIAAAIVLAGTGFIIYKSVKRFIGSDEPQTPQENNITLFKCHMFTTLTDADIEGIKKVVTDAVGDKVLKISKGDFPLAKTQFITDSNGGDVNVGDVVYITFSILSDEELTKLVTALVDTYKLDEKYLGININDIMEITEAYGREYDAK